MTMMRIAEVAERTGVPATTLRYYEDIGLLSPAGRSNNGYREYDDRDLARLAFISRAKQLDIRLDELRELVDVWDSDDCSQVQHRMLAVVDGRVAETRARMADLALLSAQLQAAVTRLSNTPAVAGGCGPDCACMAEAAGRTDVLPMPVLRAGSARTDPAAISCTLPPEAAPDRMGDWQALLSRATGRVIIEDGVALTFRPDVALTTEIARLAAAESECCSFFRFSIGVDADGVRLEIGAPPEAQHLVTEFFGSAS
jgi:DNA-binding transcriptional MerR regulator